MAASAKNCGYWLIVLAVNFLITDTFAQYYINYQTPDQCKKGPGDSTHEFFDLSQLRCTECAQDTTYQTVSADGLRCICKEGMRLTNDFGGAVINCEPCPANQATSEDGWSCVVCHQDNPYNPVTNKCEACVESAVEIERLLNGSWMDGTPSHKCEACELKTKPNADNTRCERCSQVLSVLPTQTDCICPAENLAGGICFEEATDLIDENPQLYKVNFDGLSFVSAYYSENIRAAQGMCQSKYSNLSACQTLGNMCVHSLYSYASTSRSVFHADACALFWQMLWDSTIYVDLNRGWPANMPWLYYLQDTADQVLTDSRITTEFTFPDSSLQFKVAMYSLNGTFLGLKDANNGRIQLCKSSESVMNSAFQFGTTYSQSCDISVSEFWDEETYPAVFYDMYLEYTASSGDKQLFAVPVLITNYVSADSQNVNQGSDRQQWQLVRRFFLVDNISGKPVSSTSSTGTGTQPAEESSSGSVQARAVRYAQTMKIHISLQEGTTNGRIYPPYLEITYAVVKEADYNTAKKAKVTFDVTYSMDLGQYNKDMEIALGVLSAFALVYSFIQTWSWSKRSAKVAIDTVTLLKFVFFTLGTLANVFFVVTVGASLWWLIFYKRQSSVYLILPTQDQESTFVGYVAAAFALKFIHLIHMFIAQVSVDVFFMDWERPRGKVMSSNDAQEKGQEAPVSIWRTYFIANEWNEIQTTRKINNLFQIFAVVFFLNVVGFENLATADPQSSLNPSSEDYYAPHSRIFRFAIAALIYILIAVVQWIFYTFIYERFVEDKVRQYVDLCSMSNVSVFILENSHFGYYIHGRSVHGRADTDMREMHENLKREEEDLCGQRGLMPNTEQQTFMISVPKRLRNQYDKVLLPLYADQQQAARGGGQTGGAKLNPLIEKSIDAYKVLNRFLQAFIDHALRDVDYLIKDKTLLESILNMEFQDPTDKGIFYNDDGHSFDAVLFFGNETTLTMFEILLFNIVDLMSANFVLSAVLTYIAMEIITMLRDSAGKSNLAKKTLVDKRFLI